MVRLALVAALLALPCSVFGSGFLALVASGTPAEVRSTIEKGADVNERGDNGWTPLMLAAANSAYPEVIGLLIEAGARINPSPELISVLLKAGADARLESSEGKTAYELALGNSALAGSEQLEELRRAGH
jgi:ankyrin repeat protein